MRPLVRRLAQEASSGVMRTRCLEPNPYIVAVRCLIVGHSEGVFAMPLFQTPDTGLPRQPRFDLLDGGSWGLGVALRTRTEDGGH